MYVLPISTNSDHLSLCFCCFKAKTCISTVLAVTKKNMYQAFQDPSELCGILKILFEHKTKFYSLPLRHLPPNNIRFSRLTSIGGKMCKQVYYSNSNRCTCVI